MQALFQFDRNPDTSIEYVRFFLAEQLRYPELETFSLGLVEGTLAQREAIDDLLKRSAANWKLERMTPVDRSILRLAVYEFAFAAERTPPRVAISEAVEIAKRFSSADAGRFVNGVLDAVARSIEPPADPAADDAPPSESDD